MGDRKWYPRWNPFPVTMTGSKGLAVTDLADEALGVAGLAVGLKQFSEENAIKQH